MSFISSLKVFSQEIGIQERLLFIIVFSAKTISYDLFVMKMQLMYCAIKVHDKTWRKDRECNDNNRCKESVGCKHDARLLLRELIEMASVCCLLLWRGKDRINYSALLVMRKVTHPSAHCPWFHLVVVVVLLLKTCKRAHPVVHQDCWDSLSIYSMLTYTEFISHFLLFCPNYLHTNDGASKWYTTCHCCHGICDHDHQLYFIISFYMYLLE